MTKPPTTPTPTITASSPANSHCTTSETSKRSAPTTSNAATSTQPHKTTKNYSPGSSNPHGNSASPTDQAQCPSAPTPANDSPNASPTGNDNAKTPATPQTPATPKSPSTINWHTLTPSAHWTITHIAEPISNGYTTNEIAAKTGHTRTWIEHQLEQLRNELLAEEP
jgi:hypothetical protein